MIATPFVSFYCWNGFFCDCKHFYETHIAYRLALIHSQFKPTVWTLEVPT